MRRKVYTKDKSKKKKIQKQEIPRKNEKVNMTKDKNQKKKKKKQHGS